MMNNSTRRRGRDESVGELQCHDLDDIGRAEDPWTAEDFWSRFECPDCGTNVRVDEDGCCYYCGRDAEGVVE